MPKAPLVVLLALLALPAVGAPAPTLIHDPALRATVRRQLAEQRRLARHRDKALFGVLGGRITPEERDALEFLFAFMPLSDLADYDGGHYLRVVQATLAARRTMPWAASIPEDIFLHYVLPHRVNTESLDDSRPVLFAELEDRVKGLPLADAVLEVNHWCHERVAYQPSDMRTSAPLATIRTSWGRCGEESTLVVAALRAVGIPARQVYTPRWAHVDDNHAWVEAWVDGAWRHLGACEPAPALDMAWFSEPARRAMMVHTKVMGGSQGPEDKNQSTPWFDEINVLSTYASTEVRAVKVVDGASGEPVKGAEVEFGLYNAAEFYPLATRRTGSDGRATLVSGKGDLRIWVTKGDLVGYGKLSAQSGEVAIVLHPFDGAERVESVDLVPPAAPPARPTTVSAEAQDRNQRRLAEEDRLREAYAASFPSEAGSGEMARELGVDPRTLWPLVHKSQGNWREIADFLRQTPEKHRRVALELLGAVSDKDLRDTPASVLKDHLEHSAIETSGLAESDRGLFVSAVLSPRIAHELLRPWRGYLQQAFGPRFLADVRRDPVKAVHWVRRHVRLDADANYYRVPLSPRGVHELLRADALSRDIFFVALCRAAGVPARLAPATSRPQFRQGGVWTTVTWEGEPPAAGPTGTISLSTDLETPPEYFVHFTLARFENGRYETLDFEGRPWSDFEKAFEAPAGYYVLTTGRRKSDGSVLCRQHFFELRPGEAKTLPLAIRAAQEGPPALGRLDLSGPLASLAGGTDIDLKTLGRAKGLVLAWINPGDEPTNHAVRDMERLRASFEEWGGGLVLALEGSAESGAAKPPETGSLPRQTVVALDPGSALLKKILALLGRPASARLPVFLAVTSEGDVIFFSDGYNIGVGEQVLDRVRQAER